MKKGTEQQQLRVLGAKIPSSSGVVVPCMAPVKDVIVPANGVDLRWEWSPNNSVIFAAGRPTVRGGQSIQ